MENVKEVYKPLESFDDSIIFKLPGSGSSRDDCGEPVYLGHLDGPKVHYVIRTKSCHRRECPVCHKDWIKRESLAAMDRLQLYNDNTHRKTVHYVVSPPQSYSYHVTGGKYVKKISKKTGKEYSSWVDSESPGFHQLRVKAYAVARQRGVKGGLLVFHERAIRYSDPSKYTITHCSDGPHFHILGDGWLSNVKEFYLEDGWIVKNLRVRSKGSEYNTLWYILEHSAVGYPANSQSSKVIIDAVTWFGSMAYNKLKCPKYQGSDKIYCKICDAEIDKNEWFVLTWLGKKDPPGESGEADQGENGFYVGRPLTGWSGFA